MNFVKKIAIAATFFAAIIFQTDSVARARARSAMPATPTTQLSKTQEQVAVDEMMTTERKK